MWVGGILYEHGHRLIASTVGCLTIVLAAGCGSAKPRRWMRWLGVAALGAVVAQGVLGGLTVLFFLPAANFDRPRRPGRNLLLPDGRDRAVHVAGWIAGIGRRGRRRRFAAWRPARPLLIYSQILVGATMRHTGAGLAIPDFPLMFGHLVPDHWIAKIAIHFAHRVGAALVTLAVLATSAHVWYAPSPHAAS